MTLARRITKFAFLIFAFCALVAPSTRAADEALPPSRADVQQRQADAIILFDGADSLTFERPAKHSEPFPLTELSKRVAAATKERAMIVVIMSKPTRMWPDDKFKSIVDDLEARLRKTGFKKVIFHLASGDVPTPIYRE